MQKSELPTAKQNTVVDIKQTNTNATENKEEWSSEADFPIPDESNGHWFTIDPEMYKGATLEEFLDSVKVCPPAKK